MVFKAACISAFVPREALIAPRIMGLSSLCMLLYNLLYFSAAIAWAFAGFALTNSENIFPLATMRLNALPLAAPRVGKLLSPIDFALILGIKRTMFAGLLGSGIWKITLAKQAFFVFKLFSCLLKHFFGALHSADSPVRHHCLCLF